MKNESFWQSVHCAIQGLVSGFRAERNFKIYTVIALVFLMFNILLSAGIYDYIVFIILTCGVFAAEYINTAIEKIADSYCSDYDSNIKFIKDVAAGAVLVMGIAFFTAEGTILISKLL